MATRELIARAEESLECVTPGPWFADLCCETITSDFGDELFEMCDATDHDMVFAAASRQLVPDLIAALRAADARVAELEAKLSTVRAELNPPAEWPTHLAARAAIDAAKRAGARVAALEAHAGEAP